MSNGNEPAKDETDAIGYKVMNSQNSSDPHKEESAVQRVVNINSPQTTKYCLNNISTAKYNVFTFLPKFLFEQFRRYANIFFLLIAILQQFPNVSPTGRYTTAVPLFIIITISALKEIVEDFKRHKADESTNNSKVLVVKEGTLVEITWKELQVGDIVKLTNSQGIPADIVIMSSSEPHAMCYIETSNLDGETNLKLRQGIKRTSDFLKVSDFESIAGQINCEIPNKHLYEFCGNIDLRDGHNKLPLNNDQLLLRGASIRNTKWIFGIVVYTGHETKVMLNSTTPPLKRSTVERMTNRYILGLCFLLFCLTLITSVSNVIWTRIYKDSAWYLGFDRLAPNNFGLMILTAFIMFHTIIPISLQVTLEMVRFIQAYFINWDVDMYDKDTNTPANARTSNLNEELGQVKYIFSDKTGTLTRNVMEFKQCSIAGVMYGRDAGPDSSAMEDEALLAKIRGVDPKVDMFFRALAVCHTVVPEKDSEDAGGEIIYQASSPDESALVKAARRLGYVFHTRTPDGVKISVNGVDSQYQVLNVLEFTSDRKRMSVIVRGPDKRILLFTKGADNVIYERLSEAVPATERAVTLAHLEEFAKIGLRTLCIAVAEVPEADYTAWHSTFLHASVAIDQRERRLMEAAELIERRLSLLGATAIEDKLQAEVPETISNLAKAGIKIWVLTGDKQETAINIGYSCQLLTQAMSLCVLEADSLDKTRTELTGLLAKFGDTVGKENEVGFIVAGETLKFALDFQCRADFLAIAMSCKAVICCRVSPSQKAEVVSLVKTSVKDAVTLAIGDGANDVGMIQAAHVGVGISGLEGLQAACSSDYAIAQFRFLNRLLLVHGAWNYNRLTKLILYSFYKNVCLFVIQFWFAMVSGFSGQIIFERWSIGFYNVIFTAAPPLALGLFDRSCSAENSLKYPQLYREMQTNSTFNFKVFLTWILNSLYHSLLLFWLPVWANSHDITFSNGQTSSLLFLGNMIYTYVVITVCIKAGLEHIAWTWLSHLAIWGSVAAWFIYFIVCSHLYQIIGFFPSMTLMYQAVFSSGNFWLGLILVPATCLSRDIAWKSVKRTLFESLRERVMQMEKRNQDPGKIIPPVEARRKVGKGLLKAFRRTSRRPDGTIEDVDDTNRGFAFSQEERGVVSQSQLIRRYDSTMRKPEGN